jgi:hypothetical protein
MPDQQGPCVRQRLAGRDIAPARESRHILIRYLERCRLGAHGNVTGDVQAGKTADYPA